ncbi:hypothetical protein [Streptomyces bacillaris]|uniref:hypothetical protein n=1 Tax=Streptomyces bacillaris TaxID=68179 RepID=UPI0037F7A66D
MFVHGIGGLRDAAEERREWLNALADGARAAGHADAVSGLTQGRLAETRFADYSDLFTDPDAQGAEAIPGAGALGGPEDRQDTEFMTAFVRALIDEVDHQARERGDRRTAAVAEDALAQLPDEDGEDDQEQGVASRSAYWAGS